jgi:antitoxin VapB
MALCIKHEEADKLARELSATTGESLTEAVLNALRERVYREKSKRRTLRARDELRAVRERCRRLPVLDNRTSDEILGYDDSGLPH